MTPLITHLGQEIYFQLIYYLIFIQVILSWIRPNPRNQIVMLLYNPDPILEPFRMLLLIKYWWNDDFTMVIYPSIQLTSSNKLFLLFKHLLQILNKYLKINM